MHKFTQHSCYYDGWIQVLEGPLSIFEYSGESISATKFIFLVKDKYKWTLHFVMN